VIGFQPESVIAFSRDGDRNHPGTLIAFAPES
jgi:hypothetical protein